VALFWGWSRSKMLVGASNRKLRWDSPPSMTWQAEFQRVGFSQSRSRLWFESTVLPAALTAMYTTAESQMALPKVTVASQDRNRARAERDLSCRADKPNKRMALATAKVRLWSRADTSSTAGRAWAATVEAMTRARAVVFKAMVCETGGRCAVADDVPV
jgi:hypothetical protein